MQEYPLRNRVAVCGNDLASGRTPQEVQEFGGCGIGGRPLQQDRLLFDWGMGIGRNRHAAGRLGQPPVPGLRCRDQSQRRIPGCHEMQGLGDVLAEYELLLDAVP